MRRSTSTMTSGCICMSWRVRLRRGASMVTRVEVAGPGAFALLASMPSASALLLGRRDDVLARNPLGHALVAGHLVFTDSDDPATHPNQLRLLFLDAHTRELHRDWADESASAVASPRFVAGQYSDDRALAGLVGELSMNNREFARRWAERDVRLCSGGTKRPRHPEVSDASLIDQPRSALSLFRGHVAGKMIRAWGTDDRPGVSYRRYRHLKMRS